MLKGEVINMTHDSEGTLMFLNEFEPLIHKTLNSLNISQYQNDYEDFFQEFQIQLLKILHKFQSDSTDLDEINYKFVAYAKQGLYWHGLNLLRKKNQQPYQPIGIDEQEWLVHSDISAADFIKSTVEIEEFFDLAKERLSEKEYLFMMQLIEGKYTMQVIADAYGVSRMTIYNWKEKIQIKLQDIKDCLTD